MAAVFRQVAMNRFEHAVHTERREAGELSVDRFAELWLETQADLLGDSVELDDDYGVWWSYVRHFVDAPGYVYAYAYGHLLALSVYRRYEEEGEAFVPAYLELLRAGGSRPPEELGAIVGVDLADPGFWSSGLDLIERQLEAAEARRAGGRTAVSDRRGRGAHPAARRRGGAHPAAGRRGAPHRGVVRARGVPALLGRALVERGGARPRRLACARCAGARPLELGCGLGLPSIAAARAGGRVLASDWSPDALLATAANAAPQRRARSRRSVCSWAAPEPLVERAPWPLVLASDVLYERRNVDLLLDLLPRLADGAQRGADRRPGPPAGRRFLERAALSGGFGPPASPRSARVSIHRLRRRVA